MSYAPKQCPHCEQSFPWLDEAKVRHDHAGRRSFNAHWMLTWHIEDEHADKLFTCGRQHEGPQGLGGPKAYWDAEGKCSYCGSLHPDKLFAAIEDGTALLGATDKNYKLYVELPNPREGEMEALSSRNFPPAEGEKGWIEATPENCERYGYKPSSDSQSWFMLSPLGPMTNNKFYFQHFDEEQCRRFVELYNANRMKFSTYGEDPKTGEYGRHVVARGFYRYPFFMGRAPKEEAA